MCGTVVSKSLSGALDICRLVVHPVTHRRGVATALLDAVDSIEPAELTIVSAGTANLPAVALYRRRGFILSASTRSRPASRSRCWNARTHRHLSQSTTFENCSSSRERR
ncbi:GNAT family N-acetyltransferase [Streptomyces sp. 4N509B]|uniref:GNAT family N-acetyltransferase n=1 Tax=Streptomyces sp. 4N509B TaxID=3457413 RepID=UPI003FD2C506